MIEVIPVVETLPIQAVHDPSATPVASFMVAAHEVQTQSFAQHLQRLRILSLNGCMFPTADVLTEMVSHLNGRSLSFISLVGCRTLEDQHVNTLLSKCSQQQKK